ncbi:hypothetical protein SAMN05421780_101228 [Flexibacter flexilis DSM 6793]|uniref:Uncharacterized protein n=1 Tax=Flexibacter flexilis DSM 6793 TaxID=927664 RepID=A0A1I1DHJ5_9BACT|nr:hypothetical protein [Flexibacter flexilis]SFB74439.1 hypothetical protein SAMN05421780_101228 [Flexibacter flexilis DSM 6793]
MEDNTNILVFGANADILEVLHRVINNQTQWKAQTIQPDVDAWPVGLPNLKLVLLSSGLTEAQEQHIRQTVQTQWPAVPVVQHYGGGSGLLFGELKQYLS